MDDCQQTSSQVDMSARARQLIRYGVLTLMVLALALAANAIADGAVLRLYGILLVLTLLVASYQYNRLGQTAVALTLMLFGVWFEVVISIVTTGVSVVPLFGWFPVMIACAGLLGGRWQALFWFAISIFTISVLLALQWHWSGLATPSDPWHIGMHLLSQAAVMAALVLSVLELNRRYDQQINHQLQRRADEMAQRRRAEADARASDAAKTQFLANMSHEIRTPLTSIIGFSTRLLKRRAVAEGQDLEALQSVHRNGKVLLHLVNELLELAEIESAEPQVSAVAFSVESVVRESVGALQPTASSFGLQLQFQAAGQAQVRTDSARLHQIVKNLIYFAICQTRDGVIEVCTQPYQTKDRSGVQIVIADNSHGISEKDLEYAFEAHYEFVLNHDKDLPISALTLVLTARLVRLLQGTIEVHSKLGSGTRFKVWLPSHPETT